MTRTLLERVDDDEERGDHIGGCDWGAGQALGDGADGTADPRMSCHVVQAGMGPLDFKIESQPPLRLRSERLKFGTMTEEQPPASGEPGDQSSAAFVDGRTDEEKLAELLRYPEGTHLEFKADLDHASTEAKLRFVKDVVAMSNTPPGGYILVGVDNAGNPCLQIGTLSRTSFDAARLGDLVRGYIEGRVELSVAIHEVDDHEVVVIFVHPHKDGLPVPMSKVGNYPDPKDSNKQKTAFREGEIPVREGAQNVPLRRAHWPIILAGYTRQIRSEGTEVAQAILREFLAERGAAEIPLLVDMDESTFARAMRAQLESDKGDVRLRRFLKTVVKPIDSRSDLEVFRNALDKWTVFSAQALFAERTDLVDTAIKMLVEAYATLGIDAEDSRRRLDVVIRLYALGSMAVRESAWGIVHALALQPVPSNPYDSQYIYSSWIRHAQVDASRANLLPENRGGFLISAPRELLVEHPAMRPDVEDDEIPPADDLAPDDVLLNSLCQFDLAYCFVVTAEGKGNGGGYPSSAALKDFRAKPVSLRIVSSADVRRQLFPTSDDMDIASALAEVYEYTEREAGKYRMWWDMPAPVTRWVSENRPAPEFM